MLLEFFLAQQEKITQLQLATQSVDEIKIQCEKITTYKKNTFSQFLQVSNEIKLIPHRILDEDYAKLFMKNSDTFLDDSLLFAIFTSPLNDSWKEILACKAEDSFAIRTGFYRNEFDIYQSILFGFQGLTIFVSGLDVFQIQYLTEVAREYAFSLFFVVHDKKELNLVLETDAPYIVFSAFEKKNFSKNTSFLYNLSQFVPKSANLFALAPWEVTKDKKILQELGFCGLIVS
ncbi:MAG: hypothetical protein V4591_00340 [Bdellovibrionota bacterium]